jgi:hypothetical protein
MCHEFKTPQRSSKTTATSRDGTEPEGRLPASSSPLNNGSRCGALMKSTYKRRRAQSENHSFTRTTEGPVPHLRIHAGGHVLDCPVKVHPRSSSEDLPRPCRSDDGRYLHVLPGGAVIPGRFA